VVRAGVVTIASAHASALLTVCNPRTVSAFVQIACFHDVSTIDQKDEPLPNAEERQHVPPPGQNVPGAERGRIDDRQSIDEISRSQGGVVSLDGNDVQGCSRRPSQKTSVMGTPGDG
jgi:hypothetical protein